LEIGGFLRNTTGDERSPFLIKGYCVYVFFSAASCKKDITFGEHLKQIFSSSYFVRALKVSFLNELKQHGDSNVFLAKLAPQLLLFKGLFSS
jgi:hypothetical protein